MNPLPKRGWSRFSLRTLLLGVLFMGSAATLYVHWNPWLNVLTLKIPTGTISSAEFSPDDSMIVCNIDNSEKRPGSLILLDSHTGRQIQRIDSKGGGWLTPNSRWLHVGYCTGETIDTNTEALYDVTTGQCILGEDGNIAVMRFSEDTHRLLVLYRDREPEILHEQDFRRLLKLKGATSGRSDAFLSAEGRYAFIYHQLWDCNSGTLLYQAERNEDIKPCFSPNGEWLIVGIHYSTDTPPSTVTIVETKNGTVLARIPGWMSLQSISSDNHWGAINTPEGVALYDFEKKRLLPTRLNRWILDDNIFSPDNKLLLTFNYSTISTWEIASEQLDATARRIIRRASPEWVLWRSDRILMATYNDTAWTWNIRTGEQRTLPGKVGIAHSNNIVATRPAGMKRINDRTAIWNIDTGEDLGTVEGTFSPGEFITQDARRIVTQCGDQTLRVWEWHRDPGFIGVLKTAELWVFVVLLVAFGSSVWRDRRA